MRGVIRKEPPPPWDVIVISRYEKSRHGSRRPGLKEVTILSLTGVPAAVSLSPNATSQ